MANNFPHETQPEHGMFVLRQVEALRELGWEARVVRLLPWVPLRLQRWKQYTAVPSAYTYSGFPVAVARVILLPRWGLIESIGKQTSTFMREQILSFRPDIIHAQGIVPAGLMAVNHRRPVVLTAHGSDAYDYPYRRRSLLRVAKEVIKSADRVVAVSQFIANHVEHLGGSASVVFNGADPKVFFPVDRSTARKQLGLPANGNMVAFAGYVVRSKGIFELIDALADVADLRPRLLVAGEGSALNEVRTVLRGIGIDHNFYGVVSHENLALIMAAADIVALPSHREGLPTVICEAMLAGRAVVATDVGGIPEIVIERQTGFLVPPRDRKRLSGALRDVLISPALRRSLEQQAHEFAMNHLTWARNALAYDSIFRSLLGASEERAGDNVVRVT